MVKRMGRPKAELVLSDFEKEELKRITRRQRVGAAVALRARIVLACARGLDNTDVAEELDVTPHTVGRWRRRFVESRLDGLFDEQRPGRPRSVTDDDVERIVDS
mgnify:FL=1